MILKEFIEHRSSVLLAGDIVGKLGDSRGLIYRNALAELIKTKA